MRSPVKHSFSTVAKKIKQSNMRCTVDQMLELKPPLLIEMYMSDMMHLLQLGLGSRI